MKFLSLFSGVGGFDLGLERAGMECVGQVENNDFCNKVLKMHWPNVLRLGDIHNVTGKEFGSIDIICGGYPCQPDSGAGKRRGQNDDRWLWPEMFRIIKTVRPTWVIGENVINHENMGLKVVISDLESEGYEVRAFIIPNAACELPTVERHIWVVAATSSIRLKRGETIAYQDNRDKRQFQGTDTRNERRWYLSESRVCRVRQGLPFQMDRVKALGNAVSPQVVEFIGRFIMEIETKGVKYV
jgi:DNA (cytosine-5)-methyltransferase 1